MLLCANHKHLRSGRKLCKLSLPVQRECPSTCTYKYWHPRREHLSCAQQCTYSHYILQHLRPQACQALWPIANNHVQAAYGLFPVSLHRFSIHARQQSDEVWAVVDGMPIPVEGCPNVYHCGFSSKDSFGSTSYLIVRESGNVLVDSPRFDKHLLTQIQVSQLRHDTARLDQCLWGCQSSPVGVCSMRLYMSDLVAPGETCLLRIDLYRGADVSDKAQ